LDRVLLVATVLCAGAVPSFIAQYRQRLGGRLDQVLIDLAPFQKIADQFHGGSLEALVRHHLASGDRTFHTEGAAVRAMMDSAASLRAAASALNSDLAHQLLYLVRHTDPSIARATWDIFVPSVPLDAEALIFAALAGLVVWLLAAALWWLVAVACHRWRRAPVRSRRP
jgi:Protein of unknown function (DUF2937)